MYSKDEIETVWRECVVLKHRCGHEIKEVLKRDLRHF